ncbi:uncharacterized protein [Coffea arabica]|uniref:Reverse transcriptase domain-containing protein n=1 Tax=Coffea arabica TaxID=13443 RepID=A0ABM4UAG1_COFAR
MVVVEAMNKAGGMALLWKDELMDIGVTIGNMKEKSNKDWIEVYVATPGHSILLFDTMRNLGKRKKRFYFDKRWLKREDIGEVIRTAWEQEIDGSRMFKWEGDKNTKFFHASVQGRRRRNRLNKLQREDGTWTESEHAVSKEIAEYYRNLLNSNDVGDLTESVNHTVITLIPKVLNPTSLKQFRPISLCTTMYKVIAKILTNRLKGVLHCCICKNQSAFIPSRQILDNIMVSHEYLHYLNNKRQGKDGFMAVKLDMSKAYNRVEWSFLEAIMQKMGFHYRWRNWIMECVRSVSYSFNINGEVKEYVIPTSGIRQGDHLSPYLFLLCSEGFSNLNQQAAETRKISGMKISRHGPSITHLFFADDSLIFCKENKGQATELMRVLQVYASGSGQLINLNKSSILFSKNVRLHLKHEIYQVVEYAKCYSRQVSRLTNGGIKIKAADFWFCQIKYTTENEQVEKQVLKYSRLCKELNSLMSNYWWGEANGKNKVHWCSWRKLTQSKNMGGLGFKDLMAFNAALLGKQVWRLITQPNLLVSQVMKAKYFPRTSIFRCKVPNTASWIWRSLIGARELMEQGTRRRIGNGNNTNIWEDSWILSNINGKVTTRRHMDNGLQKVHELICQKTWNTNSVFKNFNRQDAERILAIPISLSGKEDSHFWIYGTDGNYSVNSGYKLQGSKTDMEVSPYSMERNDGATWEFLQLVDINFGCQIWKARNEMEFNGKKKQPWKTIQKAQQERLEMVELDTKESWMSTKETAALHHTSRSLTQGDQGPHQGWALRARSSGSTLVDEANALKLAMCKTATTQSREVQFQVQNPQILNHIRTN